MVKKIMALALALSFVGLLVMPTDAQARRGRGECDPQNDEFNPALCEA